MPVVSVPLLIIGAIAAIAGGAYAGSQLDDAWDQPTQTTIVNDPTEDVYVGSPPSTTSWTTYAIPVIIGGAVIYYFMRKK